MNYLVSMKHTHRSDRFITLWRPDNCGYTHMKLAAGIYSEIKKGYHDSECDSIAVPVEKLEKLFAESQYGTNERQICLPNVKEVWESLGLKMTKNGLARKTLKK